MTNPYDRAEQRPASRLDPDPLYVDNFGQQVQAAEFVDPETGRTNTTFWIVASALVVAAAIAVAMLLLAAPRAAPEASEGSIQGQPGVSHSVTAPVRVAPVESSRAERRDVPQTVIGPPLLGEVPDTATSVIGTASWYCGGGSACTRGYPEGTMAAAAGPALRVGDWRGRIVRVCAGGRCVRVALIDWCACPRRVIDLYRAAFARLADPSRGLVRVEVTWGGRSTAPLPPTSTGETP